MAVNGLEMPLSITAAHFHDVPRGHPAFKYIETLYDYSTQSSEPFFHYEVRNYLNYHWGSQSPKGPPVYVYPGHAVTAKMATEILSGLLRKPLTSPKNPDAMLTRGEAAMLIDALHTQQGD